MATSLLIIDDEPKMCSVLARMLARDGYQVDWTDNPRNAASLLDARTFDIVLCDLRMPELSGIDVLELVKARSPSTDFVMMTAYATPQTAVESMKKGAIDYLIKPFSIEDLKLLVRRIEATRRELPDTDGEAGGVEDIAAHGAERQAKDTPRAAAPGGEPAFMAESVPGGAEEYATVGVEPAIPGVIAESPQMLEVMIRIRKVAGSGASVLLRGESGTGKEVVARILHDLSQRAAERLVAVNCGAIPESLMESELFGHIKGSFTGAMDNRKGLFEAADGGTVFLDEIGELPLHLQVKLLRVLQEGEIQRVGESVQRKVNVRVIAATNRDLEGDVARGGFRKDLYYRLNVIPVILPPLRDRRLDIGPLIRLFLGRFTAAGHRPPVVTAAAERLLMEYDYPGNIRELENAIEHAVVLCNGSEIVPGDLPLQIQESAPGGRAWDGAARFGSAMAGGQGHEGLSESDYSPAASPAISHLEQAEISLIMQALEKTSYNFTRAAQHLGITRRTLGYRINKYGLYDEIIKQKNLAG